MKKVLLQIAQFLSIVFSATFFVLAASMTWDCLYGWAIAFLIITLLFFRLFVVANNAEERIKEEEQFRKLNNYTNDYER